MRLIKWISAIIGINLAIALSVHSIWAAGVDEREIDGLLSSNMCPNSLIEQASEEECKKDCDAKYDAPSKPWQACYQGMSECREQVSRLNHKINQWNMRYEA
jgi:hypothetical protein